MGLVANATLTDAMTTDQNILCTWFWNSGMQRSVFESVDFFFQVGARCYYRDQHLNILQLTS